MKHVILFSILLLLVVTELEGCRRGYKGIKKSKCLVNPCRGRKCKGAKCRPNYCGGCNRLWYNEGGSDVTKKCESEDNVLDKTQNFQCPPSNLCSGGLHTPCFVNPCDGATCSNHPNAQCCPLYCNGCHNIWFVNDDEVTC